MQLYECLESPHSRLSEDDPQGHLDQWHDLEQEILSLIFEEQRSDSLNSVLNRAARAAAQVRVSLSSDTAAHREPVQCRAYFGLGLCLHRRSAGRAESLYRDTRRSPRHRSGEHHPRPRLAFSQPRKTRRALHPTGRSFPRHHGAADPGTWPTLEMLLEVADSSMTYRSRYFTVLQAAPVLDLLMNDDANPRVARLPVADLFEALPLAVRQALGRWLAALKAETAWRWPRPMLLRADVRMLCQPGASSVREPLDQLLAATGAAAARVYRMPSPMSISATRKWSAPLDLSGLPPDHVRLRGSRLGIASRRPRLTPRNLPKQSCRGTRVCAILPAPPAPATHQTTSATR